MELEVKKNVMEINENIYFMKKIIEDMKINKTERNLENQTVNLKMYLTEIEDYMKDISNKNQDVDVVELLEDMNVDTSIIYIALKIVSKKDSTYHSDYYNKVMSSLILNCVVAKADPDPKAIRKNIHQSTLNYKNAITCIEEIWSMAEENDFNYTWLLNKDYIQTLNFLYDIADKAITYIEKYIDSDRIEDYLINNEMNIKKYQKKRIEFQKRLMEE